jgi:hypothetical protein
VSLLQVRFPRIAVWALLVLPTAGCGPAGVGQVSGKVTFRGDPVTEGTIEFASSDYAADVPLESDGSYEFETPDGGLPPGEYAVAIHPVMVPDPRDNPERTPPALIEKDDPKIPKKYRSLQTSNLTRTVVEGKNSFNFDLE